MLSKTAFIELCENQLEQHLNLLQNEIESLQSDMAGESKSSAGDKFETSREMFSARLNQLEISRNHFLQQRTQLRRLKTHQPSKVVAWGSYIKTEKASFLIGIPLSIPKLEKKGIYSIGLQSPLAQAFLGKKQNDKIQYAKLTYRIIELD